MALSTFRVFIFCFYVQIVPDLTSGDGSPLAYLSPLSLSTSLFSGTTRCPRLISFTFPRLGINYFRREKGFSKPFSGRMWLRSQDLGTRHTLYFGGCFCALLVDRSRGRVFTHICIYISVSAFLSRMSWLHINISGCNLTL